MHSGNRSLYLRLDFRSKTRSFRARGSTVIYGRQVAVSSKFSLYTEKVLKSLPFRQPRAPHSDRASRIGTVPQMRQLDTASQLSQILAQCKREGRARKGYTPMDGCCYPDSCLLHPASDRGRIHEHFFPSELQGDGL